MAWLKVWTKKWNLKASFLFYELIFLTMGLLASEVSKMIAEKLRTWSIMSPFLPYMKEGKLFFQYQREMEGGTYFWILTWLNPILSGLSFFVIGAFLFWGFCRFYQDKIQPVVQNLSTLQGISKEADTENENELTRLYQKLKWAYARQQREKIQVQYQKEALEKEISSLGHYLKNPLTVLRGDVTLLSMIDASKTPIYEETLTSLSTNVKRIEGGIQRISTLNFRAATQFHFKSHPIYEIEEKLCDAVKGLSGKELVFHKTKGQQILSVDMEKLQEAFENIVDNAMTHSRKCIQISFLWREASFHILVWDDGPGFSKEALKKATHRFYSENPGSQNMGLGLTIAKQVVIAHRGRLEIYNEAGGAMVAMILKPN